jgi:PAS domain-containing protein
VTTPEALVLEGSILLCFWLCLSAWQRDAKTPGRRSFMILTSLAMCWGTGELAVVHGWLDEWAADRIKYLACTLLPPFWLNFAARTSPKSSSKLSPWLPFAVAAPALAIYSLLYSDEWSRLFLDTIAGGEDVRGPLWLVFASYELAVTLAGSALLIAPAFRPQRSDDWRHLPVMGCFGLIPLAGIGAYLLWESRWLFDPTPIFLGIGLVGLRRGLFSGSLFQALSISQHELIHQLPHGIIVTDSGGTVIEMNPAGEEILGLPVDAALGRSLTALLDYVEADLDVQTIPIDPADNDGAQLVMIEPAAKQYPMPSRR